MQMITIIIIMQFMKIHVFKLSKEHSHYS